MPPKTPLDDLEFLASSGNRVEVLETLATEPATRAALHERTGISQPTLGRILEGFETRGWIRKTGQQYRLSRLGTLLAEELARLLDTVDTIQRLTELESQLPTDEMAFDFREFRDATVTVPRSPDVFAHIRRAEALIEAADSVRTLTGNMYLDAIPKQRTLVLEQGQIQEVVISAAAFDAAISHPEAVSWMRDVLAAENMSTYRYEGAVPFSIGLVDDTALILPYDDHSVPCALIETENETIREWVETTIDAYRDRATRVTVDDLPS
ncbi:helix-turn-helix transcriptional regulator [Halorarius litoreus]|uniref:helix-turn-helix transcriptional regulator n=1 Tax=Halorarius litoreus TaxID=2962676 RepID=UPI0020CE2ADC|nr:helix-turn-helix domain-containing protein [Halorarius litoreus]